jgi:cysteinyl-tRNA synthetase
MQFLQTALSSKLAALEGATVSENDRSELLASMRDPWCDLLDQSKGSTITNPALFTKLTQHWEAEFHKDMQALNVRLARHHMRSVDMAGAGYRSSLPMC